MGGAPVALTPYFGRCASPSWLPLPCHSARGTAGRGAMRQLGSAGGASLHASQRNGRGTAASAQLTASLTWHRNSHRALYALLSPVLLAALLLTACSVPRARRAGTRLQQDNGGRAQSITVFPSAPAPQVLWRREIQIRATVDWYLAHLALDQKLGQMFLSETVWKNYNAPVGDTDAMVRQMHA